MKEAGTLGDEPKPPSDQKYQSQQWRLAQARGKPWLQKCWDLPDWVFLSAIETARTLRSMEANINHTTATRWDIAAVLAGHPFDVVSGKSTQDYPGVPPRLVIAKARRLIQRGIIDGCACGCRGDYSIVGGRA